MTPPILLVALCGALAVFLIVVAVGREAAARVVRTLGVQTQPDISFVRPNDVQTVCPHPDSWFDRSLCTVDDWMHTRCTACGEALDGLCGAAA